MSGDKYNLRRSVRIKNQGASSPPRNKRLKTEAKSPTIDDEPKLPPKPVKLPVLSTDFMLWSLRENPDVSFAPSRSPSPVTIPSYLIPVDTIRTKSEALAVALPIPKTQGQRNEEEGDRGAPKPPAVIDITDDESILDAAISNSGYHQALKTLEPQSWLNDDVVFGTLRWLAMQDDEFGVMNPTLFSAASAWDTPPAYFRPHHERRLGNKKTLLIPVCHQSHWTLFVWSSDGGVRFYDSLFSPSHLAEGAKMLQTFWSAAFGSNKPIQEPVRAVCARQTNGYDCGLHVIRNGDSLIRARDPNRPEPPVDPVQMRNHYRAIFENSIP